MSAENFLLTRALQQRLNGMIYATAAQKGLSPVAGYGIADGCAAMSTDRMARKRWQALTLKKPIQYELGWKGDHSQTEGTLRLLPLYFLLITTTRQFEFIVPEPEWGRYA